MSTQVIPLSTPSLPTSVAVLNRYGLRIGSLCLLVGTLVYGVAGAFHGDLPTGTVETALTYIAARPYWQLIHLSAVAGVLLWIAGFVALADSLPQGAGRVMGWLTVASLIVGTAIFSIDYLIDGYVFKALADEWTMASGALKTDLLTTAATALRILSGTFRGYMIFTFGLPILLGGFTLLFQRPYPMWAGWLGILSGGAALLAGVTGYLGLSLIPEWLFFTVILGTEQIWLLVVAWLLWRHSTR